MIQGAGQFDAKLLKAEKLRRLREEGLRLYSPHKQQLMFHKSPAKIRALFGGNQSGKSWGKNNEICLTIGKVHPWRKNYSGAVFARDCYQNEDVLYKVAIPTYQRIVPRKPCTLPGLTFEGKPRTWCGLKGYTWDSAFDKQFNMLYLEDGSFIEFKTYQQAKTNLQSFAGPPRHIIAHDEEPPIDVYSENTARQVTLGVNILFAMTPLQYSEWLYSDIYEASRTNPDIAAFKMSSYENPTADVEALDFIKENEPDPAIRAARLYGEFTYLEGRVWKGYGDHNLCDPFRIPDEWQRSVVIDPHPSKPTAVNWFAEDHSGRLYCYREADIKGDVEHVCQQIRSMTGGEYINLWLIDPAAKGQMHTHGGDSILPEYRKYFPYIIEANNDRHTGWDKVGRYVKAGADGQKPKLLVFKDCQATHHQMKNYSWKPPTKTGEDRVKPDVVKRNDDHCDCVRYRVMASYEDRGFDFKGFGVSVYGAA